MSRRQHHKGKARPRGWHRGRHQGKINDRRLRVAEPAFDRAEADRAETAELAAMSRADREDWLELWTSLDRVSPVVLASFPLL